MSINVVYLDLDGILIDWDSFFKHKSLDAIEYVLNNNFDNKLIHNKSKNNKDNPSDYELLTLNEYDFLCSELSDEYLQPKANSKNDTNQTKQTMDLKSNNQEQQQQICNTTEIIKAQPDFSIFFELASWLKNNNINVELLSSMSSSQKTVCLTQQQKKWLEMNGLDFLTTRFSCSLNKKEQLAHPDALLIDYNIKDIRHFRDRGGEAIQHINIGQTFQELTYFFPNFDIEDIDNQSLFQELTRKSVFFD